MVSPTHADICFYCSALISPYWLLHTGSAQIYIIPTPGPSIFEMMGQGQVRPIKFCFGEPRPGPARQNFRGWAAAQPGPSNFQRMGPGPAQLITFSKLPARPVPAHHFFNNLGPARPCPSHGSEAHETRALCGPAHVLPRNKR